MRKFVHCFSGIVWIAAAVVPILLGGLLWLLLFAPVFLLKILLGGMILFSLWVLFSILVSLLRFAVNE